MTNSRQSTELGVLSVVLPPPPFPLNQAFYPCLSCARAGFQQNVPMVAHSTLIQAPPPPTDTHTGISRELHPFSTVCPHTPATRFPQPQCLPFCKNQLTSPIHNLMISPIICTGHFPGSKTK